MSIERYDCNSETYHSHHGAFVRHDDHLAALTAERERVETLKAANWQAAILHGDTLARAEKAEAEREALHERADRAEAERDALQAEVELWKGRSGKVVGQRWRL